MDKKHLFEKHLFGGHELLVGEEPPPDFNGFTVSEEDFRKMQEAGALTLKVKDTSRKRNRDKYQTRRRRLKKLSKHSKRGNRR